MSNSNQSRSKHFVCSLKIAAFLMFFSGPAIAQQGNIQAPEGRFLKDSIKVGEPVDFTFSIRHSLNTQVLFPDSTYSFAPFELVSRKYFPTVSNDTSSLDSIVYTFITFETEPKLQLSIPAFILTGRDSVPVYNAPAYINILQTVTTLPKEPDLKSNTGLQLIKRTINYPYILIGLGIFLVLAYLLFLVFGKGIVRYYSLNTLGLRQRRFELVYSKLLKQWEQKKTTDVLEKLLITWKEHLERLDDKPYSAFTTKEITAVLPNEPIKDKLQRIDAAIYGAGDQFVVPTPHLMALLVVSRNLYNKRKKELRNGRS